jgi:hypothetical protein
MSQLSSDPPFRLAPLSYRRGSPSTSSATLPPIRCRSVLVQSIRFIGSVIVLLLTYSRLRRRIKQPLRAAPVMSFKRRRSHCTIRAAARRLGSCTRKHPLGTDAVLHDADAARVLMSARNSGRPTATPHNRWTRGSEARSRRRPLAGCVDSWYTVGGNRLLEACRARLALAQRLKRGSQVVLRHGPLKRHALAGVLLQRGTVGGDRSWLAPGLVCYLLFFQANLEAASRTGIAS